MKRTLTIALVVGALSVAGAANAQSLKWTGYQLNPINSGTLKLNGSNTETNLGALTFDTGTSTILTYCADLTAALNFNNNPYTSGIVNITGNTGMGLAAKILSTSFSEFANADQQAGLQLAIWEAIYDNGATFGSGNGNFSVVSGVNANSLAYASTYYAAGKNSGAVSNVELFTAQGAGGQSQLHVVPEPASMAALGLGALALIRRRRNKK